MKLAIVLGTVRENRLSERLAQWVYKTAATRPEIEAELVDLKDYPMPFFDEPLSPRYNKDRKVNEVAQKWLERLSEADAYIFVTPEYNHSIPGVLKNALDYVTFELVHKPATVVSHGTVGGARAAMHLKEILSESRACIIPAQVAFIGLSQHVDEQGKLDEATESQPVGPHTALAAMLDDLQWYSNALAAARAHAAS